MNKKSEEKIRRLSNEQKWALLQEGDTASWDWMYTGPVSQLRRRIMASLRLRLRHANQPFLDQESEEIAQRCIEVFLRIMRRRKAPTDASPAGYLMGIGDLEVKQYFSKGQKEAIRVLLDLISKVGPALPADLGGVIAGRRQTPAEMIGFLKRSIRKQAARMGQVERQIVEMILEKGRVPGVKVIARLTGEPWRNVRSRVERTLKLLSKRMEPIIGSLPAHEQEFFYDIVESASSSRAEFWQVVDEVRRQIGGVRPEEDEE